MIYKCSFISLCKRFFAWLFFSDKLQC